MIQPPNGDVELSEENIKFIPEKENIISNFKNNKNSYFSIY